MKNDIFLFFFNRSWIQQYSVYENDPSSPIKEEEEYLYTLLNKFEVKYLWLDLCSCTGRLIRIANNLNFKKIIAIDYNPQCEEIIHLKINAAQFICGDVRTTDWHQDNRIYNSSSIITMGCGTIQCFNDNEQIEIFKKAHCALHENGKLVLSFWNKMSNFPLYHIKKPPVFNQNLKHSLHYLEDIYSHVEVTKTEFFTFISSTK